MIFISHRGNLNGPNSHFENDPEYIQKALSSGFDVEVDVWYEHKQFYLGHDFGIYHIDRSFLINSHLWCHAKDIETFIELTKTPMIHSFFHQQDDCTLTSKGFIWMYPGKELPSSNGIILLYHPSEKIELIKKQYAGICSDYVNQFK